MMKVKRFNNLWTMGLILFGSLLVLFYIAKIFFPQFIIGVAEIPRIVQIGNYIDNHKWAYYIVYFALSYLGGYIFCCACCRTKRLNWKSNCILCAFIIISYIIQVAFTDIFSAYNYVSFLIFPFLSLFFNKRLSVKSLTSTIICYSVDIMAQSLSMAIRNVVIMTLHPNTATLTILMIDTWIWRMLLYCFFNNEKEN